MSNGLRVWIVEQHELPVVQMSLLVLAGTDADPRGRYGIASLTSAMLTEGAGSRSAVEIADALDALLANLSASSDVDSTSLQLYVPVCASRRGAAADGRRGAAADVSDAGARDPAAAAPGRRCATRASDPDAIAALAFARSSYGPSHRSAAALIGTTDSLKALTAEDLRAFHAAAYRPDNSTLIVVGDVTPDQVLPLLETHFGKWQAPGVGRAASRHGAGAAQALRAR